MACIPVFYQQDILQKKAQHIAKNLGSSCTQHIQSDGITLEVTANTLRIHAPHLMRHPLQLDFIHQQALIMNSIAQHPLKKALGKKAQYARVYDLTAGLGKDSLVLANIAKHVTAIEKHPLIYMLLEDALSRANTLNLPLHFIQSDAHHFLAYAEPADIIYLDPMFQPTNKSRLVKKPLQILSAILGPNTTPDDRLFNAAYQAALHRVIVKRAKNAPSISERTPSMCISNNQSTRYDIYIK